MKHPSPSQIAAAKLLIRMLEKDREPVDAELRAVADTEPVTTTAGSVPRAATETVRTPATSDSALDPWRVLGVEEDEIDRAFADQPQGLLASWRPQERSRSSVRLAARGGGTRRRTRRP